jgi:putative ATPase
VDEIHRFNKAQQDAFLPHVEKGTIVLGGATTENPSFALNAALLSRCTVCVLDPLAMDQVLVILRRALTDRERGLAALELTVEDKALELMAARTDGDARRALNALEVAAAAVGESGRITEETAAEALRARTLLYDREGEEHYNLISALHKAVRGSDPDGALYWLARMLASGEEPLYIARRLVRMASEDIGNADPRALPLAVAARDAYHFLGSPEGELALAQCVLYLASAPKSNATYTALAAAMRDVKERPAEPVPLHIRNAPTPLMEKLGYGRGYRYDPDEPDGLAPQTYLPESLEGRRYYDPPPRGMEEEIRRRLEAWRKLRAEKSGRRPAKGK